MPTLMILSGLMLMVITIGIAVKKIENEDWVLFIAFIGGLGWVLFLIGTAMLLPVSHSGVIVNSSSSVAYDPIMASGAGMGMGW
jgi:hypothetical protein